MHETISNTNLEKSSKPPRKSRADFKKASKKIYVSDNVSKCGRC